MGIDLMDVIPLLFTLIRKFMNSSLRLTKRSCATRGCVALLGTLALSLSSLYAQSVNFTALKGAGGKASSSSCVLLDDKGTLATVVELGSDTKNATLLVGNKKVPLKWLVSNAESRVAIYQIPSESLGLLKGQVTLGDSHSLKSGQAVFTSPTDHGDTSRVVSRVNRFQGQVLPLAVLRINHSQAAPRQGSGIYDAAGNLVAIVRQSVYNTPKSSYCLPSEVIARILADYKRNGRVSRCWIGIIMDERVASPIIESVRPGSPAQKAGLQTGDVILQIGNHDVAEYAEVVDAFYYLVAGQTQKFKILRGTEIKEFDVTPEVNPGREVR